MLVAQNFLFKMLATTRLFTSTTLRNPGERAIERRPGASGYGFVIRRFAKSTSVPAASKLRRKIPLRVPVT